MNHIFDFAAGFLLLFVGFIWDRENILNVGVKVGITIVGIWGIVLFFKG